MTLKFSQIQPLVLHGNRKGYDGKTVSLHFLVCFSSVPSNFGLIGLPTAELAALERLKKSPKAYNGKMMSPIFLRCSRSDLFHGCR